ncbi:MAG: alanine dehydrogenase [Limisphaerales bacterium]|jgi:alanine dehydrogenase
MEESKKPGFAELATQAGWQTLEKQAAVGYKSSHLYIGVPKEHSFEENRVALTPDSVRTLVNNDHTVVIEAGAGERAHFSDREYADAGARIVYETEKVFEADIIVKVAPLAQDDADLLHDRQTLISPIHLPTLKGDLLQTLMRKRATAIAFEFFKDENGTFPFVRSMSEIAGNSAILIASELLSDDTHGKGMLLGGITGIPPTKVLILGAGVVGEYAARAALGLGATVMVFDNNIYKLLRLQNNIGTRLYTSTINPEVLAAELCTADVAVGAIHSELGRTPVVVNEEMIANMKPGSVIVDISIDQGGCFETSELTTTTKPTFKKYDVIHYCVSNIASRVSNTASTAVSNIVTTSLFKAADSGGFENLIRHSAGARHGVYIYNGFLTNLHLSQSFGMKYTELDLLMASSM